jgi:hypothetical protein
MRNNKEDKTFYNSYIQCSCSKKQTVQLGWKLYGYGNMFITYPFLVVLIVSLILKLPDQNVGVIVFVAILALVSFMNYATGYREVYGVMSKAGHTRECCKKVSMRGAPYYGAYSEYKLMQ